MKINICKNHTLDYFGFVVQPGMLLGYDENNTPYVTNGHIYSYIQSGKRNEFVYVYFMIGQNIYGKYTWTKKQITQKTHDGLFTTILKGIKKRGTDFINYMTASLLESDKWSKRENENFFDFEYKENVLKSKPEGVLFSGVRSTHYGFRDKRPTTV